MRESLVVDSNALIGLFDGGRLIAERLFRAGSILVPIAAIALETGSVILTDDSHLRRLPLVSRH